MDISEARIGMRVVPTGPDSWGNEVSNWRMNIKGYLIVCEIRSGLVECHENGRKQNWGNEPRWLKFPPENLEPWDENLAWHYKERRLTNG